MQLYCTTLLEYIFLKSTYCRLYTARDKRRLPPRLPAVAGHPNHGINLDLVLYLAWSWYTHKRLSTINSVVRHSVLGNVAVVIGIFLCHPFDQAALSLCYPRFRINNILVCRTTKFQQNDCCTYTLRSFPVRRNAQSIIIPKITGAKVRRTSYFHLHYSQVPFLVEG